MKKSESGGYVRADQIDLKSLDEQLQRHLSRAWTMEKNKEKEEEEVEGRSTRSRQEWEIDPSKLVIKTVIARGTFGTVHRGIYDGQDVAGSTLSYEVFSVFTSCLSPLFSYVPNHVYKERAK